MMTPRQRETFPPVALGHIRGHGCYDPAPAGDERSHRSHARLSCFGL